MNKKLITSIAAAITSAALIGALVYSYWPKNSARTNLLAYSTFMVKARKGLIATAVIHPGVGDEPHKIQGKLSDGKDYSVLAPFDPTMMPTLLKDGVKVNVSENNGSTWETILMQLGPDLLTIVFMLWILRTVAGGKGSGKGIFGIRKSPATLLVEGQVKTKLADVAGVEEAKEEVAEVVQFLKSPEKFKEVGGKIPRGILMSGPPGTGKTLLAKAIAGEAGVPFFSASGSSFVEMFVGIGAARVRDMFEQARKKAPCILFIDEIDAVGKKRDGKNIGSGNDEREQTLNQILVEMDGFDETQNVIVIAATNLAESLDSALTRPGRFDRKVEVTLPDVNGRNKILEVHSKNVKLADGVNLMDIARGTPGFSGAELANLVNEAALLTARLERKTVDNDAFERAKDKIMMGSERRSISMNARERRITAYHEAGHAVVALMTEGHDPVHKVSIVPRGNALGVTLFLPEADRYSYSRGFLNGQLDALFGGRAAEHLVFGEDGVTSGAANDIERATEIARNMVVRWGLSSLGARHYGNHSLEGEPSESMADETRLLVDQEIDRILAVSQARVNALLREHRDLLEAIAQALIEHECLDRDQIDALLANHRTRSQAA